VVVTVRAPASLRVLCPTGRLASVGLEKAELEKAEWLVDETAGALRGLDRSSRRDAENLVASLIQFEMLLRRAERAAAFDPGAVANLREERSSQADRNSRRLRSRLADAVQTEALDEFDYAARFHLGLVPEPAVAPVAPTPEIPPVVQVRPVGRPYSFQGVLDASGRSNWLVWAPVGGTPSVDHLRYLGLIVAVALSPVVAWLIAKRSTHPHRTGYVVLAAGLSFVAYWSGPFWLTAGVGMASLGWVSRE
jgi:hypothetical protein